MTMSRIAGWGPRYTAHNPCPVCGGHSRMPQHRGERCWGRYSADGDRALCVREEYAGQLQDSGTGYLHFLKGLCRCGVSHDGSVALKAPPRPAPKQQGPRTGEPIEALIEEEGMFAGLVPPNEKPSRTIDFEIRNLDGRLLAIHRRTEYEHRSKEMRWFAADGRTPSLNGKPLTSLPLYGSEKLRRLPRGSQVIICEGEKAATALNARFEAMGLNILALGTSTGAGATPDVKVLAPLVQHDVTFWPDNDPEGREHCRNMAEVLRSLGAAPRWLPTPWLSRDHFDAADFDGDDDELFEYLDTAVLYIDEHVEHAEASAETGRDLRGSRHLSTRVRHKVEDIAKTMTAKLQAANEYGLADSIAGCKTTFVKGKCSNCGYEPANPVACKESICPLCFPSRLLVDWKRKAEALGLPSDTKHRLYRLHPANPVLEEPKALSIVGQRFTEARKRYKDLNAGVTGLRWSRRSGVIALVALPAGERELEGEYGPFTVEFVREVQGPEDVAFWLIDEYLTELEEVFSQASTREDAWVYLRQVQRRRRFAGFGKYHKSDDQAENESGHPDIESHIEGNPNRGVSVDYSKLSGGANLHKKGEMYPCPNCGEHAVAYTSQRVAADLVEKLNGHYRMKGA